MRDGSGIYSYPPATEGAPNTTISSTKYNAFIADVRDDLNYPRPVVAGGTGGATVTDARINLQAERATQVVTNYDTQIWEIGSFYAATTATNPPGGLAHRFAGIVYGPDSSNLVIEARDLDDTSTPGLVWVREKNAGVWGSWTTEATGFSSLFVQKIGDTMTGALVMAPTSGNSRIFLDKPASGQNSFISGRVAGSTRWQVVLGNADAESGSNAGSNFQLSPFSDAGATLGNALVITRATLAALFGGNVTLSKANPDLSIDALAGEGNVIGKRNGLLRWRMIFGDAVAEGGGNTGSNFNLLRYNDAGSMIDSVLYADRSTGLIALKGDPTAALGAATKQYVDNKAFYANVTLTVFTGNGTFSKSASCRHVLVEVWGGGGGSGGREAPAAGNTAIGCPGGAGGYSMKRIAAASLAASETVTVGAAGAAGTAGNNAGGNGGTTSFGAHCSATGGTGGPGGQQVVQGGSCATKGGTGGVGSGGDLNLKGGDGGVNAFAGGTNATFAAGGNGGNAPRGGTGGAGVTYTAAAVAGNFPGGGAAGSCSSFGSGATAAGAAGGGGGVMVWEFS